MENYNIRHDIPHENIAGNFSETQESFMREAIERYKREVIYKEVVQPDFIITEEQQNDHARELKPTLI